VPTPSPGDRSSDLDTGDELPCRRVEQRARSKGARKDHVEARPIAHLERRPVHHPVRALPVELPPHESDRDALAVFEHEHIRNPATGPTAVAPGPKEQANDRRSADVRVMGVDGNRDRDELERLELLVVIFVGHGGTVATAAAHDCRQRHNGAD
jgi:hypothetical protein